MSEVTVLRHERPVQKEQPQTAKHSNVISIRNSVKALTLNGVSDF
jgi:hypothetical protein